GSCGLLAVAGFLALDSETTVEAKKLKFEMNDCVYCAHDSAADRARNAKPPGTPGGGPGGGGGGGGKKASCSKTFAKWKNIFQLNVHINGHNGPEIAGVMLSGAQFKAYVMLSFDEWACHSGLGEDIVINYVASAAAADITVKWANLGTGGILGQAATGYTRAGKSIVFSNITMNNVIPGTLGPPPATDAGCAIEAGNGVAPPNEFDLLSVMFHEVGHALGIDHSNRFCDPDGDCYEESMHPCTDVLEFMRRAANPGDRAAIEKNYGPDGP
ncbi:MAG: matrixin family metalloprotease, partial [Planctomycetota bacterium]